MSERPRTALIGATGFVGGSLRRQRSFDATYHSSDIERIAGQEFDLIVCAGAPAEKWKANAEPEQDRRNLGRLLAQLEQVRAKRLALISTVDVFGTPVGVDEESEVSLDGLHPYGRHRRELEERLSGRFATTVIRLPGLYGRGIKKNVIFDLLHHNNLERIDARGSFQFYGLDRLWRDVEIALELRLNVVHLATEPVTVAEVARAAFGHELETRLRGLPVRYDMRTRYASLFGSHSGAYIESRDEVLAGIAEFVVAERGRMAQAPAARES